MNERLSVGGRRNAFVIYFGRELLGLWNVCVCVLSRLSLSSLAPPWWIGACQWNESFTHWLRMSSASSAIISVYQLPASNTLERWRPPAWVAAEVKLCNLIASAVLRPRCGCWTLLHWCCSPPPAEFVPEGDELPPLVSAIGCRTRL